VKNIFEILKVAVVITVILFAVFYFGLWLIEKCENKL